jgi:hypothetical protein
MLPRRACFYTLAGQHSSQQAQLSSSCSGYTCGGVCLGILLRTASLGIRKPSIASSVLTDKASVAWLVLYCIGIQGQAALNPVQKLHHLTP